MLAALAIALCSCASTPGKFVDPGDATAPALARSVPTEPCEDVLHHAALPKVDADSDAGEAWAADDVALQDAYDRIDLGRACIVTVKQDYAAGAKPAAQAKGR